MADLTLWERFTNWLTGTSSVSEAYSIDVDDHLYRPLTGRDTADLPSFQHEKMLKIAMHIDRQNPVGRRVMSLITDFVFAEGVQIKTRNSTVETLIQEHWDDPLNNWDERGPRMFRQLLRDGEVVMPAGVNPVDGAIRWGTIPSRVVKEVVPDDLNWEIVRTVVLKSQSGAGDERRLAHINENPSTGRLEGECLFLKTNDDGLRGVSFLYSLADYLEALNTMVFSEVERAQLLRAFVWDVTIDGATQEQIAEMSKSPAFQVPRPGSMRIHNDSVSYQSLSPQLNAYDATNLMGWVLNTYILGSVGIPEHWFGSGGDVNRAVGEVMDQPTIKMLSRFQREWQHIMTKVLRYVIDQAVESGKLPRQVPVENADGENTGETIDPRMAFEVILPDMDTTDMTQLSQTVSQLVQALVVAEEREYLTKETARSVFIAVASQIGPDIDPDTEADKLQQQAKERDDEPAVSQDVIDQLARATQQQPQNGREREQVA